jgi:hypothetical protein
VAGQAFVKLWKFFPGFPGFGDPGEDFRVCSDGVFLRTHLPYPRQKILRMGKFNGTAPLTKI